MSFWRRDGRFPERSRKQPAPEHGIRLKKLATSWWAVRWVAALEKLSPAYAGRLERGRSYARSGRTHDFALRDGEVHAKVTGSSPDPYEVTLRLMPLPDSIWTAAIKSMASRAQFAAELLAGQMPKDIDEAFEVSLFPKTAKELQTECDCPDSSNPCKHVAAVHFVLGDALDRDPFILFELRGRSREQVLEALRASRGQQVDVSTVSSVRLDATRDYDGIGVTLPGLALSFDEPEDHEAPVRQLGAPPGWSGSGAALEALAPVIRAAARRAREAAMEELPTAPASPAAAPAAPKSGRKKKPRSTRG